MKITGTIKVLSFKDDRVVIKLSDARFLSGDKWEKQFGDVWISSFDDQVIQSVRAFDEDDDSNNIQKGSEIQAMVKVNKSKDGREFMNIVNIGLRMPEKDVNEDLVPPEEIEERMFPEEEEPLKKRDQDSIKGKAERLAEEESTTGDIMAEIEATAKDVLIIRQTCIKAGSNAVGKTKNAQSTGNSIVAIAKRLEKYVLEGK